MRIEKQIQHQLSVINHVRQSLSPQQSWVDSPVAKTVHKGFEKFARAVSPDFLWEDEYSFPSKHMKILGNKVSFHIGYWIESPSEPLKPAKKHGFILLEDLPDNRGYLLNLLNNPTENRRDLAVFLAELPDGRNSPEIMVKFDGKFKVLDHESFPPSLKGVDYADKIKEWVDAEELKICGIDE